MEIYTERARITEPHFHYYRIDRTDPVLVLLAAMFILAKCTGTVELLCRNC